jgi:hypothetical protein
VESEPPISAAITSGRIPFMCWTTSQGNDNRKNDQTNYDTNFDAREPKFKLSENPDAEIVDKEDESKEDRNPYSWIDTVSIHPVSASSI